MKFKNIVIMLTIILGISGMTAGIVFYTDYYVNRSAPISLGEISNTNSPSVQPAEYELEAVLEPIANEAGEIDGISAASFEASQDTGENDPPADSVTATTANTDSNATGTGASADAASGATASDDDDDDDDDND